MKILWINVVVIDQFFQYTSRIEIAKNLKKYGAKVRTILNYKVEKIKLEGFDEVIYFNTPKESILDKINSHLFVMNKVLREDDDIVVCNYNSVYIVLIAKLLLKLNKRYKKFILDIRTVPVDLNNNLLGKLEMKRFYLSIKIAGKYFNGISLISEPLKILIKSKCQIPEEKLFVWSSGVNLENFNYRIKETIRKKYHWEDKFIIIYHGSLSPNRGLQEVVKAIKILIKTTPKLLFLIIGEGKAKKELEKFIKENELNENIILKKKLKYEDVPKYINAADVGILPFPDIISWSVSSPLKLMEYLAMRKPVIVTDIAAHTNVVKGKDCAFIIKNNLPSNIAKAIKTIKSNKAEWKKKGENGYNLVKNDFTWEMQAGKLYKYLENI